MHKSKSHFVKELHDLYYMNDRMETILSQVAAVAANQKALDRLSEADTTPPETIESLKCLLSEFGAGDRSPHDAHMTGQVADPPEQAFAPARNIAPSGRALVAEYRRMSRNGIAGFGSARGFARALDESGAARRLGETLNDIENLDGFSFLWQEACAKSRP